MAPSLGFARVISDGVAFAYLADAYIMATARSVGTAGRGERGGVLHPGSRSEF